MIWFIPIDFIKFGLQAAFHRSIHTIKPFEHIHRRLIASKQAKATVVPLDVAERAASIRREYSRQGSQKEGAVAAAPQTRLDQIAETGSSFYSPYTATLSALRIHNPLLKPAASI